VLFAFESLLGIGLVVLHNIDVLRSMLLASQSRGGTSLMVVSHGEEYLTFLEQVPNELFLPAVI
jgi:hypothetical protein